MFLSYYMLCCLCNHFSFCISHSSNPIILVSSVSNHSTSDIVVSLLSLVYIVTLSQSSTSISVFAMAPNKATPPALTTRFVARKNGVTLHSLDAGVHKNLQCIICNKGHGSRAALSRHFKSHTTRPEELSPFTHRSCWDEKALTDYPPSRQEIWDLTIESDVFDALPSKQQQAINTKVTYAMAGVRNKKQLQELESQRRLRLLHWWFRANEGSLRARMEFGPEGLFPRQGKLITLRQGLAAKLMAWLRRKQARRSGPGTLRRGHHSGRRQPTHAHRHTANLPTRAAFRGQSPNNTSRPAGSESRPSCSLNFCPNRISRPRLRPLAQGIIYCGLRTRIHSPTHKLADTVVHEQHLYSLGQGSRRGSGLRHVPQIGHRDLSRRHRSFSRYRQQAHVALRLESYVQV